MNLKIGNWTGCWKTGWKIIDRQKWTNPLKNWYPHYYVISPIDIISFMLKEELKANSTINEYQITFSFQMKRTSI
jgi:hypothetical protein